MANDKKESQTSKSVNPTVDKGNYLIQIKVDDKVVKQSVALNATINIINIADSTVAFDVQ